ncbi:MAG: hypothetical protein QM800_12825 [Paludibacter sp.]
MTVTAQINIDTPTGRKLLKELEKHPKTVKVEYPLPDAIAGQKLYSHEEVWSEIETKFNQHYGTNHKFK